MRRLQTFLVLLCLGQRSAFSTSLVVMRTNDGYLLGTNATRSDGHHHCKLHLAKNAVALRAGQTTYLKDKTVLIDMNATLNRHIRGRKLSLQELKTLVISDTEHDTSTLLRDPDIRKVVGNLTQRFVLLAMEGKDLKFEAFDIRVRGGKNPTYQIVMQVHRLAVGQLIDLTEGAVIPASLRSDSDSGKGAVRFVLDGESRHPGIQRGMHSFEPPYTILEVKTDGSRSLVGDKNDPCRVGFGLN